VSKILSNPFNSGSLAHAALRLDPAGTGRLEPVVLMIDTQRESSVYRPGPPSCQSSFCPYAFVRHQVLGIRPEEKKEQGM